MYVLGNSSRDARVLYIFDSLENMSDAIHRKSETQSLYLSVIALQVSEDSKTCNIIKDRNGVFNPNNTYNTKKILKIIEILMEE